jgi:hypothetical protein
LNSSCERDPKEVLINAVLPISFQAQIKELLVNYHDVFAWSYKDLKGILGEICEHKIELVVNAQPVKQRKYIMNPNYALFEKNLDKLLDPKFINLIENMQWLSSLIIVPKKNRKLKMCVDYHKLHAQTKKDPFLLPFLDYVLDFIVEHEMYSLWVVIIVITRFKWLKRIKTKQLSFQNGALMFTTLCHLGYVMPLLLSKK